MKAKLGRPKVPKSKLRGILIQARLSPEESQKITAAIRRAKASKSEWLRKALLTVADSDIAA